MCLTTELVISASFIIYNKSLQQRNVCLKYSLSKGMTLTFAL